MFSINKEGRSFLHDNFITIRNEFINDGLIPFEWEWNFNSSLQLEQLYASALTRNIPNRVLTLQIYIKYQNINYYNDVVNKIKAQQQQHHVRLLFKVKVYALSVDHEELTKFLNSNHIIDLDISYLNKQLLVDDSFYQSLRSLKLIWGI